MAYRILIVEDDRDISELIDLYLTNSGYETIMTDDGNRVLDIIANQFIDLMILDIMMPKVSGYEVINQVRDKFNIPIIIVSAKTQDNDRILGLNMGADAYINKPFNPLEVVANVEALLRREHTYKNKADDEQYIRVDNMVLNVKAAVLYKQDEKIHLTSYEFKILKLLMSNPEQVFTKAEIYEKINTDEFYTGYDNTMMVHISNLRAKIEEDPANPKHIITVRGLGYKFV